ncbi:RNA polymerase sigma factor [Mesorhizobium silamurunense]|uniref:RNA polymerase sigma factor n=1 Tax=Mesorhizobium silamurunense TaxID=499528 RepID=UPI0017873013|nr:sigma-70 family RNA polymerase sigma factor [Mesorhizobium silamurunense]
MSKQKELLTLHGQLLAGDTRAASKIVELVIASLVAIVKRDVAGLHDHQDVEEACFDALFKYLAAPTNYNPQLAELTTYLAAIAKGKAMTLRRSQARRTKHEGTYSAIENTSDDPLATVDDEDSMIQQIDWERFGDHLVKDPGDAVIVNLIKVGASSVPVVAQALGLTADEAGLEEAGRRLERIRGRARRFGEGTKA